MGMRIVRRAREKVEQESKLGDFEIQSIKLLAFRRAVAGVVHQPLRSTNLPLLLPLPHPPSSSACSAPPPPPLLFPARFSALFSASSSSSTSFPSFRSFQPWLGKLPPLKCIPMYHRPTTFAHSTLEICTLCTDTRTALPASAPLFATTSTSSSLSSSLPPRHPLEPSPPPRLASRAPRHGRWNRWTRIPAPPVAGGDSTTFY